MKFATWKELWRIERNVKVPHLAVAVMTPYCFVRVLWYYCPREHKAWPNFYETGIVLGWRWPWCEEFKEKQWIHKDAMPLAIYGGPMDTVYTQRAAAEIGMIQAEDGVYDQDKAGQIGAIVRMILNRMPLCPHASYWIASCPNCARKALLTAVDLKPRLAPALRESEYERTQRQIRERLTGSPALTIEQAEAAKALQASSQDANNA